MKKLISVLLVSMSFMGCGYKVVKSYTRQSVDHPDVTVQTIVMPKEYNSKDNVYVNQTDTNRIHISRVVE